MKKSLADLFTEVLSLCKEAGFVKVGLVAIDGTKLREASVPTLKGSWRRSS